MKPVRFFIKCILAALPAIALIAFTLLCPLCYMDEEYPAWRHAKMTAAGKLYEGKSFDTVILGDSVDPCHLLHMMNCRLKERKS